MKNNKIYTFQIFAESYRDLGVRHLIFASVVLILSLLSASLFSQSMPVDKISVLMRHVFDFILNYFCAIPALFLCFVYLNFSSENRYIGFRHKILGNLAFFILFLAFVLFFITIFKFIYSYQSAQIEDNINSPSQMPVRSIYDRLVIISIALVYLSYLLIACDFIWKCWSDIKNSKKFTAIPEALWFILITSVLIVINSTYQAYLIITSMFSVPKNPPSMPGLPQLTFENIDILIGIIKLFSQGNTISFLILSTLTLISLTFTKLAPHINIMPRIKVVFIFTFGIGILLRGYTDSFFIIWSTNGEIYQSTANMLLAIAGTGIVCGWSANIILMMKNNDIQDWIWCVVFVLILCVGFLYVGSLLFFSPERNLHGHFFIGIMVNLITQFLVVLAFFAGWYAFFYDITGRFYRRSLALLHAFLVIFSLIMVLPSYYYPVKFFTPPEFLKTDKEFSILKFMLEIGGYIVLLSLITFVIACVFSISAKKQADNK